VDDVARAGSRALPVARLGDILAHGKTLPLRRDVVERVATLWVDYSLYADRVTAGDSLLDSATVVATLWPDVQQRIADHFHEKVMGAATNLDSAAVDSAYAAGTLRLIDHILIRNSPDNPPNQKAERRRTAENMRAQLMRGASWARQNEMNDDPNAKSLGGRLGVIAKGEMVAPFEAVAFALKPGELSGVTETPFGFHILRRPFLQEARADFKVGLEDRMVARLDTTFLSDLERRWEITVRSGGAAAVRAAAADPTHAERSSTVLATYKGGKFRVSDFMPWFYSMPLQQQSQVAAITDDNRITEYLRTLVRNEVLLKEAGQQNVRLTSKDMAELKDQLRRDLALLSAALEVDAASMRDSATSGAARAELVTRRIDRYLDDIANDRKRFIVVPQLLSLRLRARNDWKLVPAGIDRALERAQTLRAAADSATQQAQPGASAAPPANPQSPRTGSEEPAKIQNLPQGRPAAKGHD
jgi:hypothetical protein